MGKISTFEIKSWDEQPLDENTAGPKLTRASVSKSYSGDITGAGQLEYLMLYTSEDKAIFIGLERVVGSIGDRSGSFVFQHNGFFEGGVAKSTCRVVPDSGTGELAGLQGQATFEAVGRQVSITFEYEYS